MNGDSDRKGRELRLEPLSEREIEILELIADNLSKREVAERLSLAYSTVKWYTQQTYQKLSVHSRRQAVLRARELGLLKSPLAVKAPANAEPPNCVANPYKGLLAFQEDDASNFFGREALTERLVARLGEAGVVGRFLAVVGPSGSGKSSLVKAGLIPALRQSALPGSHRWLTLEMTPGSHPFEQLEAALLRIGGDPALNLLEQLQQDKLGFLLAVCDALPSDESQLLLVIDQFEEVFTLVEDKGEARGFLESLYAAVTDQSSPLRVVITSRADFFDHLLQDPDISRLVQDCTEVVIPLTIDEMERAIRAPAEQSGVYMDSGLVAAIVAEMVEQPGALPLLQYALTEIFEGRKGSQLTLEGYQAVGGVRGVLERRAETTYAGLSHAGRAAARQAFLRLVTLGEGMSLEGLSIPDTRRRVLRAELEAVMLPSQPSLPVSDPLEIEPPAAITEALDAFGKARLLYFDRDAVAHSPTVEIAHEALLSEWGRLRGWLDEGRGDVRMQRALGRAAAEWARSDHDASFLLRGTRLSLFENWVDVADLALTGEEILFMEASKAERNARQIAEAARKKREATLERRARIFLRTLAIVLLLATLASLALASTARTEAGQATSRELAVLAINNLQTDPERSILLSLQALHTADTREAVDALHQSIQSSRVRATINEHSGPVWMTEFSPDGKALVTSNDAGQVTLWGTGSWQKLLSLSGTVARFSPDGARLAVGGADGTITIWDLATRTRLLVMKGHHQVIDSLRFSPDGRLLVSTSDDRTFIVWNMETGQKLFSSNVTGSASFSPDGKLLITDEETESGYRINLWGVNRDWALLGQLSGYEKPVFSPNGRWLVSAGGGVLGDGIVLWDLSDADLEALDLSALEPQIVSAAHANVILNLAFSSDSSLLASASMDGTAKLWRLSGKGLEPLITLSGHTGEVYDAAFSPDGTQLATTGQDGTVRIWDITSAGASEWFAFAGHLDSRYRMSVTQNGRYLATGSDDGVANVWDVKTGKQLLAMTRHGGPLFSAGISPDGSLLATAGYDNVAKIWKLNLAAETFTAKPQLILDGHATGPKVGGLFPGLTAAVFSPDGTRLATGGVDGIARIWDVKTGQQLLHVQVHPDHRGVTSLTFSPDGRLLATASDGPNPLAKIWNAANGAEISTFSGLHQFDRIWGLAFSPDGKRMASSSQGGGLKIWDAQTGQELLSFQGHTSTIVGVAFSPDGKYLASASADGTARIWDSFSGAALQIYISPTGALINIAFTPDGKRLVASGAGYIYGYIFDQDELVKLAESRLTRGFTPEECRQFLHLDECPPP